MVRNWNKNLAAVSLMDGGDTVKKEEEKKLLDSTTVTQAAQDVVKDVVKNSTENIASKIAGEIFNSNYIGELAQKSVQNAINNLAETNKGGSVVTGANSSVFTKEDIQSMINDFKEGNKVNVDASTMPETNNDVSDVVSAIVEETYKDTPSEEKTVITEPSVSSETQTTNYTPLQPFQVSDEYKQAMEYTNQLLAKLNGGTTSRTEEINALLSEYKNREAFSYDPAEDALFQQMLGQAMASGQMAMQDTIGQAAALSGGYGNTYATAAGNNAYNQQIQGAYDNLPAYYQLALDNYNQEGEELLNQIALLNQEDAKEYERLLAALEMNYNNANNLYNQEYAAWRDTVSDRQYENAFEYQKEQDALSQSNWEREYLDGLAQYDEQFGYQKEQDALAQENYENEFAYQKEQDALAQENWERTFDYNTSVTATDATAGEEYKEPSETQVNKALEAYNSGGDEALAQYLDSLPSDIDMEKFYTYIFGNGSTQASGYGELPMEQRTFTVIDDGGINWLWGVDNNAKVTDNYGNEYSLSEIEQLLGKNFAKELSKLAKGEYATYKK